jgi:NADH dehydrogenase
MPSPHRVVILGAGFGGIQAYLELRKAKRRDLKITIVNRTNYFLFTPLLHEVATGSLGEHNVVEAVREIIGKDSAQFIRAEAHGMHLGEKKVHTSAGDIPYDTLIIGTGASTNYYGIPGAEEHGLVLKSLSDALMIKNRIIDHFERAAQTKDAAERKRLLSFIVIGAGATGVETVTEMADLFNDTMRRFYRNEFKPKEVSLTLVAADAELLMPFHPSIRRKAAKVIERAGVSIKLKTAVKEVRTDGIVLGDGSILPASTVIWAAGVKSSMPQPNEGMTCDKGGRAMVDEFLRVADKEGVYALGDAACSPSGPEGKPLPMLAQVAVQQGRAVARNILASLNKQPLTPFKFFMKGQLVSLGRGQAAAQIGPLQLTGPIAWFVWRTVYFFEFHSWSKRFKIGTDWFVNLFFPRDVTRA